MKKMSKRFYKPAKRFYSPQFDALGSYTGSGLDPFDTPEQDADDL